VLVGGDFNCTDSSEPFNVYLQNGFKDTYGLAASADSSASAYGWPKWDPLRNIFTKQITSTDYYSSAIDHLLVLGEGIEFNSYDYLTDPASMTVSDHSPLVVDIGLK